VDPTDALLVYTGAMFPLATQADVGGSPDSPRRSWLLAIHCLLAAAVAHVFVHFVLSPGNPWIGFPVHSDDFGNLAHTSFEWSWPAIRPVSQLGIRFLSACGLPVFYLALHGLSVLHVALVFFFACRLLEVRPSFPLLAAGALSTMSFEGMVERYRYTGTITSLVSGTLGLAGLIVLWSAFDRSRGAVVWLGTGLALSGLALLGKEDLYAASLAVVAYAAAWGRSQRERRRGRISLTVLLAMGAAFAVHSLWFAPSPFLGAAGASHHVVDLRPDRIALTAWRFLTVTPGAGLGGLALLAAVLLGASRRSCDGSRIALVTTVVLLLIAPYAVFPDRVYAYYAPNWVPWQFAALTAVVASAPPRTNRLARAFALGGLAAVTMGLTAAGREGLLRFYSDQGARSRRTIELLAGLRPALAGEGQVAVAGVSMLNPWRVSDGTYIANRVALAPHWFVLADDAYLAGLASFRIPFDNGLVSTRSLRDVGRLEAMPVLILRPDGSGSTGRIAPASEPPSRLDTGACAGGRGAARGTVDVAWVATGLVVLWQRSPSELWLGRGDGPGRAAVAVEEGALLTLERGAGGASEGWLAAAVVPIGGRPCP